MPGRSGATTIARDWVAKAEGDLRAAAHLLGIDRERPTDIIRFHAQQCAEKYIKAFLVFQSIDFPRIHDLEKLIALLPASLRPSLTVEEQRRLTGYATAARYPGSGEISLAEAKQAVAVARRIRREIRRVLPREVFRRRTS